MNAIRIGNMRAYEADIRHIGRMNIRDPLHLHWINKAPSKSAHTSSNCHRHLTSETKTCAESRHDLSLPATINALSILART